MVVSGFYRFGRTWRAGIPAGATWDWTVDAADDLSLTGDSIAVAEWLLPAGLTAGAVVNTATRTTMLITAPPLPSPRPYPVAVRYTTAGGIVTPITFHLFVIDPARAC